MPSLDVRRGTINRIYFKIKLYLLFVRPVRYVIPIRLRRYIGYSESEANSKNEELCFCRFVFVIVTLYRLVYTACVFINELNTDFRTLTTRY